MDGNWAEQTNTQIPSVSPQTHLVNARTNLGWEAINNGRKIKGRVNWHSWPLRVRVLQSTATSSFTTSIPSTKDKPVITSTPPNLTASGSKVNVKKTDIYIFCVMLIFMFL